MRIRLYEEDIVGIVCTGGNHRASVVGRFAEGIINEVKDENGDRKYNCKLFTIDGRASKSAEEATKTLEEAKEWLKDAWEIVPAVVRDDDENSYRAFYAYAACSTSKLATTNWWKAFALCKSLSDESKVKTEDVEVQLIRRTR